MTSRTNTGAAMGVQNLTYGTKKNIGILFKNLSSKTTMLQILDYYAIILK